MKTTNDPPPGKTGGHGISASLSRMFEQYIRPHLGSRFRNYRVARYIFYITLFWAVSIFLAPLTLSPGTVNELDANANWIDYGDDWMEMARYNPYAAAIYAFGDLNCHQRHTRSQEFNGNQLPVCARDVGIALGAVAGALMLFYVIRTPDMFLTFLSVLPEPPRTALLRHRPPWLAAGLIALPFILPTGFDGTYQLLTDYESTNTIRLITGFFLGIILAWGFGSAFLSVTVPVPVYLQSSYPGVSHPVSGAPSVSHPSPPAPPAPLPPGPSLSSSDPGSDVRSPPVFKRSPEDASGPDPHPAGVNLHSGPTPSPGATPTGTPGQPPETTHLPATPGRPAPDPETTHLPATPGGPAPDPGADHPLPSRPSLPEDRT